ncbi:hypothetical protein BS17DRAFT_784775 [Gyrodon lividus]|nr:hypothetical protein BS17DRAFT_784775 [Gyrodon lividus]
MLGEADAKFPGQTGGGIAPSPTRENPGQVYPKSDPQAAPASTIPGTGFQPDLSSVIGNPYLFENALSRLDDSLDDLIRILENEEATVGSSSKELKYLEKFQSWRDELKEMRNPQSSYYLTSEQAAVSSESGEGLFLE